MAMLLKIFYSISNFLFANIIKLVENKKLYFYEYVSILSNVKTI